MFDVISISNTKIILAQLKSNTWPGPEERQAIISFLIPRCEHKIVEKHLVRINDHLGGRGKKRVWHIWDVTHLIETYHKIYAVTEE